MKKSATRSSVISKTASDEGSLNEQFNAETWRASLPPNSIKNVRNVCVEELRSILPPDALEWFDKTGKTDVTSIPFHWPQFLADFVYRARNFDRICKEFPIDVIVEEAYELGRLCMAFAIFKATENRENNEVGSLKCKLERFANVELGLQIGRITRAKKAEEKASVAFFELYRRCSENPEKSPSEHLGEMAQERIKSGNKEKAKWGSRRTLFGYGLIQQVKDVKKRSN